MAALKRQMEVEEELATTNPQKNWPKRQKERKRKEAKRERESDEYFDYL